MTCDYGCKDLRQIVLNTTFSNRFSAGILHLRRNSMVTLRMPTFSGRWFATVGHVVPWSQEDAGSSDVSLRILKDRCRRSGIWFMIGGQAPLVSYLKARPLNSTRHSPRLAAQAVIRGRLPATGGVQPRRSGGLRRAAAPFGFRAPRSFSWNISGTGLSG